VIPGRDGGGGSATVGADRPGRHGRGRCVRGHAPGARSGGYRRGRAGEPVRGVLRTPGRHPPLAWNGRGSGPGGDRATGRAPGGMAAEAQCLWALIVLFVMVVGGVYAAMHLGHALADTGVAVPASPFEVFFGLLDGTLPWPGMAGVVVLAVIGLLLVLLVVAGFLLKRRLMPKRSRVDASAAYLGRGKDVAEISAKTAREKAQRMGVESAPGVPIGRKVSGGDWLYGSWEDTHLDIWGPRT